MKVEVGDITDFDLGRRFDFIIAPFRVIQNEEKFILYPELIYRRYEGEILAEKSVLKLVMRCYDPETFEELIENHGFQVMQKWGGYAGERYGEGPELVIQFSHPLRS